LCYAKQADNGAPKDIRVTQSCIFAIRRTQTSLGVDEPCDALHSSPDKILSADFIV
jgi:hypothetical protein